MWKNYEIELKYKTPSVKVTVVSSKRHSVSSPSISQTIALSLVDERASGDFWGCILRSAVPLFSFTL
jgi:hypothetical protein